MPDKLELRMLMKMADVLLCAGKQIVYTRHVVAPSQQPVNQV
jgi:hypothetical protein